MTISSRQDVGEASEDAPVTYWKNSTLSTSSYRPQDDKGKELDRQYTVRTSFEIKFRDFERLSILASMLSTKQHFEISHIEWRLTDATKASLASQSRQEAIKDAMVKARDYAAVLTRGRPEAVEVFDSSTDYGGQLAVGRRMTGHGGYHSTGQQGEVLDFESETVQFTSSVTVKFVTD